VAEPLLPPSELLGRLEALATQVLTRLPPGERPSGVELDELSALASTALLTGEIDDALALYGWLVGTEPGHPEHHFGLGLCLQQVGEARQAAEHFVLAFSLNPADPACAFRLGECLLALGHLDEARDALNIALTLCRQAPATDQQQALIPLIQQGLQALH
jgi:tetratricopeptide (TPR) repeat protein